MLVLAGKVEAIDCSLGKNGGKVKAIGRPEKVISPAKGKGFVCGP